MNLIQLKKQSQTSNFVTCFIYLNRRIQLINEKMSSFKSKMALLKDTLNQEQQPQHHHQTVILKECRSNTKQELSLQHPIIIEKKTVVKSENVQRRTKTNQVQINGQSTMSFQAPARKKVQPWIPVNIPPREKKIDVQSINVPVSQNNNNKQIQIQIQKDDKNKDCLKKLFKKLKKLEEELKQSQKQRVRLNLELQNYKGRSKTCGEHDKIIAKLQGQKYRIQVDLDMTRKLLRERQDQIKRLESRVPKEIIKEVIVEKPVQVIVEVTKLVPGPERIVEKIVQIPKYIEVQKKVPYEVIREVQKQVIRTVQIPTPTIVQKPIYIEKPIYIDRPPIEIQKRVEVPIEVPVEVPIEYPVYIQKPVVQEEFLIKMRELEAAYQATLKQNAILNSENIELRTRVGYLGENLEMMRRHNEEKNRQVQILLQNSIDYLPFSPPPYQDQSLGSVKYSISSNPHPRVI